MDEQERWEAYRVCKQRGHQPVDRILPTFPAQSICKHCATIFRIETVQHEMNPPRPIRMEEEDGS